MTSYISIFSSNNILIFMLLSWNNLQIFHSDHRAVKLLCFKISTLVTTLKSMFLPGLLFHSCLDSGYTQWGHWEPSQQPLHKSSPKYSLVLTCSVLLPASLKPRQDADWLLSAGEQWWKYLQSIGESGYIQRNSRLGTILENMFCLKFDFLHGVMGCGVFINASLATHMHC